MVNAREGEAKRLVGLLCAATALLLAGCNTVTPPSACPLPGQARMTSLKLYFGRDIPGGGFVTDEAWSSFAARVLTPAFPAGFTATEALGQWQNPQNGHIGREKSYVVEIAGSISRQNIATVIAAYKKDFRQLAVGEVTEDICAAF